MVASAVFITDLQGKSIISRNYRGDVPLNKAIERFAKYLQSTADEHKKPVFFCDTAGDVYVEDEVGAVSPKDSSDGSLTPLGETFVYISVRLLLWKNVLLDARGLGIIVF